MKQLGAALAACADKPTSPLAIYAGEWNGDDARLEGTFVHAGPCLYIDDPSGQRWLVAFAERGLAWDDRTETVTFLGASIRAGDHVVVGGSSHPWQPDDWVHRPGEACAGHAIWRHGDP